MNSTARISNISSQTTTEELLEHFRSRGLSVAAGETRVSSVVGADGLRTAVLTFKDEASLKRALNLPSQDRQLNERQISLEDGFDGFTPLSDGDEIDMVALHGLNGHAFTTWEHRDGDDHFMWLRDCLPESPALASSRTATTRMLLVMSPSADCALLPKHFSRT